MALDHYNHLTASTGIRAEFIVFLISQQLHGQLMSSPKVLSLSDLMVLPIHIKETGDKRDVKTKCKTFMMSKMFNEENSEFTSK